MLSVAGTCAVSGSAVGATIAAALHFFAASQCLISEPWPQNARIENGSHFDFIIVGSGTAGSALAARLSEVPEFTVLLIEAGGDPPQEAIVPGFRGALKATRYDWNFTTCDDGYTSQGLEGGRQKQPRGKMLGGSGSINDMVYARGFPEDYYEWATLLGDTWNWTNVVHYFKKTENMTDEKVVDDPDLMMYHGREGEIEVTGQNKTSFAVEKFLEAFKELGFNIVDDMTNPNIIGAGRFSHTVTKGKRDSSLTALLNKAKHSNVYVLKDTLITKVLIENNTAVGVHAVSNKKEFVFYSNKDVIISAGTFNTPKILFLSGIGPEDHLKSLGIDVVKDLPVGDNLHDHVMFITYIALDNGTYMIQYLYDKTGPLSGSDSMGAYKALNDSNVPEFAFYPSCMAQNSDFYYGCSILLGYNHEVCLKLHKINQESELLVIAVVLLKPKSRGKVRLQSKNPFDDPLIYSGTFDNREDLVHYPAMLTLAWSIANTSYFADKNPYVVDISSDRCNGLDYEDVIECKIRATVTSAWHSVGTAAMGTVVDKHLKVKGIEGLRVVDASVMPKVIRGNTNAPVVMIAEKAADFIKTYYEIHNMTKDEVPPVMTPFKI
ncbi:hypothetical protein K1T71_006952 [Dendrolimus kikuchii]|uniref:Uncharacterized protein n=1 Tax=Dendrolimus kikuchii TaxID=765133 RepID=A0ACC1CZ72_9NEOP|nr:hypothetical protein K1T71_006952 [Dendrolimus kikuchii]